MLNLFSKNVKFPEGGEKIGAGGEGVSKNKQWHDFKEV